MPLYAITTQAGVLDGPCSYSSPDGGMDFYDLSRQDGFRRAAADPIVFAAPLLCDAPWEV
jgi:hypothetical protein